MAAQRKGGGGVILRLIDLSLLLLLGFLLTSDIVHKSQIKLPGPTTRSNKVLDEKNKILPVDIRIMPGDTTIPEIDPKTETSRIKLGQLYCYYLVLQEDKVFRIRSLETLENHLRITQAQYDSILVIVNPSPNSIIQGTINLIDICRRYNLNRKFQYIEGNE
jgi:biopolymer transport protein ExbD